MTDSSSFDNIRSLDELVNMASKIFFNMNAMNEAYYDIFLNPEAKTINLERYDSTGKLVTVPIKNRASELNQSYSGVGSPQGSVEAKVGAIYVDTSTSNVYYKAYGDDAYNWILILSEDNFTAGRNYLAPTGDAKDLTNLNMDNANSGTLTVGRGGTGNTSLTGILKGNGTSPFSVAVDGVDYLGPDSMTGVICYYPVYTKTVGGQQVNAIPNGWLMCDGSGLSSSTYDNLYKIIGTTYGTGDGVTTDFSVPNLTDHFIRCWDGSSEFNTVQQPAVGQHLHAINFTSGGESAHTHDKGNMNITGSFAYHCWHSVASGAFSSNRSVDSNKRAGTTTDNNSPVAGTYFEAKNAWTGRTGAGSEHTHLISGNTENYTGYVTENRVLNKMLIPIIKY